MFSRFLAMGQKVARPVARLGAVATLTTAGVFALSSPVFADVAVNYDNVRRDIASLLDQEGYDDGSLGPIFVRLAWHASGTYSVQHGGGSNGAKMRFDPEASHGANAGLGIARDILERVKRDHPGLSYADLWTLAGAVAIEEMGGPKIAWRPGRTDAPNGDECTPDGRLPDASQGAQHIRDIFYRMGFNDQEIVALCGAHALGRCHTDRSGFSGPWTRSPTTFSNSYFTELKQSKWVPKKWRGPFQYVNEGDGALMMLPADLALLSDPEFKKWVDAYAADEQRFFKDFSSAFTKLEELGVPFKQNSSHTPLVLIGSLLALAINKGA